eukprot:31507-Pelagococcus_subviridis.AAC.1
MIDGASRFITARISFKIMSISSLGNSPATSPVIKIWLINSRKPSSLISASTGNLVQRLEVLEQRYLVVLLADRDLERERAGDVRREPRERLLPAPSDAHEKRRAAIHRQESRDAHHVQQRVLEQHQIELVRLRGFVEEPHLLVRDYFHRVQRDRRLVEGRVRVDRLSVHEIHPLLYLLRDIRAEGFLDDARDELVRPVLVLVRGELIDEHALALVPPRGHQVPVRSGDVAAERRVLHAELEPVSLREDQPLEHLRELAHVEQVVKLRGSGQHLRLDFIPQLDRDRDELERGVVKVFAARVRRESPGDELPEDVVDRRDGRQRHVKDGEVSLQAVRDVVLAAARGVHRREVLAVDDHLHVSDGLLQRVHAALLQELPDDLVRGLVAPIVHRGHGDVVHEYEELLPAGRAERPALALLHGRLHGDLENFRRRERRKRDRLGRHLLRVERVHERLNRRRLCGSRPADEQRALPDAGDHLQHVLQTHGVERGDHERRELRRLLLHGVMPIRYSVGPVVPLRVLVVDVVLEKRVSLLVAPRRRVPGAQLHELLVELGSVFQRKHPSDRPARAVDEQPFVVALAERLAARRCGSEDGFQHREQRRHGAKVSRHVLPRDPAHDGLARHGDLVRELVDVLFEERRERRGFRRLARR